LHGSFSYSSAAGECGTKHQEYRQPVDWNKNQPLQPGDFALVLQKFGEKI